MAKGITTRDFSRMLKKLGFVEVRRSGSHVLFRHSDTGLLATLPDNSKGEVPLFVARGILKQIQNYDIASDDQLEKMLKS
jgi:predicted RNA binding protein YcfA (HicA-like mRNA interferase family)